MFPIEKSPEKVLGFIERAKKEGAKVECGGERLKMEGDLAGGNFLSPCILTNVRRVSGLKTHYRVTIQVVSNLPLTTKQRLCFWYKLLKLKQNFCYNVNGRLGTTRKVTTL